jgi:HAD superfamily hydrolase (TIGR01458 family)
MTALLIDLDGVLYETGKSIPGAIRTVQWLRDEGIPHVFLTNTTSRPRAAIVEKLAGMKIAVEESDILTPPVAAAEWLSTSTSGPAALFVAPATVGEFASLEIAGPDDTSVGAVVVGDYGDRWTFAELNRAFRLLMTEPGPALVALGMTRYWQADDGLRLDTGPFVTALSHASGVKPVVLGKPARPFFEAALARLGASPATTLMIGDDIQGDVGGAQAAGIRGALVRTGKFRESDLEGDVCPDVVLGSLADVPDRWADIAAATGSTS